MGIRKGSLLAASALAAFLLSACGSAPVFFNMVTPEPGVMDFAPTPSPTPEPTSAPTPTPSPTPEPTPAYVRIGAVGDIMMMQSQVQGAWNGELDDFDFTPSFAAMQAVFHRADILCGNLETPLAGKENGGYSGPAPAAPTPDELGNLPKKVMQTFNAPDALARSMKESGFTVLTTANNHCLDRGAQGALRTVEVLRGAGLLQTGTYRSKEDRETHACVAEMNGIRVGFIGWTFSVNGYEGKMNAEQREFLVGRTRDEAAMLQDIAVCREAGAEFVIALPHWDTEFQQSPASSTRKMAKWMLENGVDAILGAHPHVVQPIEYLTVERAQGTYTGLIAYSMGNFISNMAPSPKDYGAYVEVTLKKDPKTNQVTLSEAGYLPLLCTKSRMDGRTLHEVLPAYADAEGELQKAFSHVTKVCGDELPVISSAEY